MTIIGDLSLSKFEFHHYHHILFFAYNGYLVENNIIMIYSLTTLVNYQNVLWEEEEGRKSFTQALGKHPIMRKIHKLSTMHNRTPTRPTQQQSALNEISM